MNLEELRKYDWVSFYDCRTNIKDKKAGAKVGQYMAISGYDQKWMIYQVYGGLPVINVWITSLADAVKIAQAIEKIYGKYLGIWEVWTDVNVLEIARLSVDHGEDLCDTLHDLVALNRPVNYNDFIALLNKHING